MLPAIQHNFINWENGMKVSKAEFIALENAFLDQMRDSYCVQLNPLNYGLLPPTSTNPYPDKYGILEIQGATQLVLANCRAITIGGMRIEVFPEDKLQLDLNAFIEQHGMNKGDKFYVVVQVDLFLRKIFKTDLEVETAELLQYTKPKYQLKIEKIQALDYSNPINFPKWFLIGKIEWNGNAFEVLDYMPACTSVMSQEALIKHFVKIDTLLEDIEKICYDKIESYATLSLQVGKSFKHFLFIQVLRYLALNYSRFHQEAKYHPPFYTLLFVNALARLIKATFSMYPGRKEVRSKFSEIHWKNINHTLEKVADRNFYHNHELKQAVILTEQFLTEWKKVFRD